MRYYLPVSRHSVNLNEISSLLGPWRSLQAADSRLVSMSSRSDGLPAKLPEASRIEERRAEPRRCRHERPRNGSLVGSTRHKEQVFWRLYGRLMEYPDISKLQFGEGFPTPPIVIVVLGSAYKRVVPLAAQTTLPSEMV
jgi:hypothetical protein